jgi:transcriptional regulator with PAS, ATPase and Fis domain
MPLSQLLKSFDRELKAELQVILNAIVEGLCGLDVRGNVTFCNDTLLRMTGYRADEMIGSNFHELLHHSRRRKMALAQKARWANIRNGSKPAAKTTSSSPAKRTMSAAARRKIAAAQKARWVKIIVPGQLGCPEAHAKSRNSKISTLSVSVRPRPRHPHPCSDGIVSTCYDNDPFGRARSRFASRFIAMQLPVVGGSDT